MIDIKAKAQQVYEHGFCILEAVYDADAMREASRILDGYWEQQGRPGMNDFGIGIHPLLEKVPHMAPYFAKQIVVDTIALVLQDPVHLVHTGARLSNEQSSASISWHNHYSWDSRDITRRDRIERVLGGVYVEGSHRDIGPLIVVPRAYNDPLAEPPGDLSSDWPGQIEVEAPPGSAVIFDTALWHTAKRGSKSGLRHLFGAHYQGWSTRAAHPEDNVCDVPSIKPYKRELPVLRALLEPPSNS